MAINMTKFRKKQSESKGKGDESLFKWSSVLESGETKKFLVRLLPTTEETCTEHELGVEEHRYHEIGNNSYGYPNQVLCLDKHANKSCPACKIATTLYGKKQGINVPLGIKLFAKKYFYYNAIIKDENGEPLFDGQPIKFKVPRTIQNGVTNQQDGFINAFIMETDGMLFDLEEGNDIKFKVFQPGNKPMEYKDVELQKSSPVFESKKERAEVMENLNDLRIGGSTLSNYDMCVELRQFFKNIEEDGALDLMDKMKFDGKKSDTVDEVVPDRNEEEVVSEDIAKALEDDLKEEEKEVEKVVEKKVKKEKPKAKVVEEPEEDGDDDGGTNEELEDLLEGL